MNIDMRRIVPMVISGIGAILKVVFDAKISKEQQDKALEISLRNMEERTDMAIDRTVSNRVSYMIEQKAVDTAASAILTAVKQVQAEEASASEISEETEETPE